MQGPTTTTLPLDAIRRDESIQPRVTLNKVTVAEYAEALEGGASFPPVTVFHDGEAYWLADGFHRHAAHLTAKRQDIPAEVREGGRRDALLFAVGANAKHGLPRSREDKQRAIGLLLADDGYRTESDRWIAEKVGVTHPTVAKARAELTGKSFQSTERTGKDGRTINTANIGKGRKAKAEQPAPAAEQEPAAGQAPTLFEQLRSKLDTAPDTGALNRTYSEVTHSPGLTSDQCEALGKVYQAQSAALRSAPAASKAEAAAREPAPVAARPVDIAAEVRRHAAANDAPPAAPAAVREEEEPSALDFGDWLFALADFAKLSTSDQGLMAQSAARLVRDTERQAWAEDVSRRAGERSTTASAPTSVERVLRLIAATRNPNENEARNAALLACRAIREGGLVVLAANDPRLAAPPVAPLYDLNDLQRRMEDSVTQAVREARVKP